MPSCGSPLFFPVWKPAMSISSSTSLFLRRLESFTAVAVVSNINKELPASSQDWEKLTSWRASKRQDICRGQALRQSHSKQGVGGFGASVGDPRIILLAVL